MGGRGSDSGGRYSGGGGLNPNDIVSTRDLISDRERNQKMVDSVMQSLYEVNSEYGVILDGIELAKLKGKGASALAYYGGGRLGVNEAYFNSRMESAYDACVKSKFHPSRGNKTAMEAVALHEMGHALTDKASAKLGHYNMDKTSTFIVKEALKQTKHKGVVKMASKISRYATASNAEAIAEAFSDVKCNGKRAKAESKAIVNVLNKYAM